MSAIDAMLTEAKNVQATTPEGAELPRPYTTRSWGEIARMNLPPPTLIWGGWAMGALGVFIGQGGLGKSRLAMNLTRNQVLGLPFAGLPTAPEPLRHLFIGSENSIHRLQYDIRRMNSGLDHAQLDLLEKNIRLATLEEFDDADITASLANEGRWRATLESFVPDVLWCDPWGDLLDGESNADEAVRYTLGAVRRWLRRVNPDAALGVLAHSRTGANNLAQAVGYDAANFLKGSKALYSSARCAWNMAPGAEGEEPPIVLVHAKCSDSPKVPPLAIRIDPDTMTYHRQEDFDFEGWRAELAEHARGRRGRPKAAALTPEAAMEALGGDARTKREAMDALRKAGATRDAADDLLRSLVVDGALETWMPPIKRPPTYYGTPEAIQRKKTAVHEQLQRKIPL